MNGRDEFYVEITKKIEDVAKQKDRVSAYAQMLLKQNNIPVDISIDILTKRKNIVAVRPEMAYAIAILLKVNTSSVFPENKRELYRKWKYREPKLPKNLEYEMIQITDDQWIGKITAAQLMQLRDAQIINYNEKTQRVMKRINRGEEEYYAIALNQKAIMQLEQLYLSGTYIPNTITLNLPEGTNFTYRNGSLYIKDLDHFDITDGYHRYIAMSNLYNEDDTFDYPMVLCITNYSEDKSRQFIWQEDQKTKMARIDSESMNMNSSANKVVSRLNMSSACNLAGMINTSGGVINSAEFAEIIKVTFFPPSKIFSKQKEILGMMAAQEALTEGINAMTQERPSLLEKRWDRPFLYCFVWNACEGTSKKKILAYTEKMAGMAQEENMFRKREVSRIDMKRLMDFRKKVEKSV